MNLAQQTATTLPAPPMPIVKQCRCSAVYTHEEWDALELCGHMPDGDGGMLELRHCVCLSTIAIQVSS